MLLERVRAEGFSGLPSIEVALSRFARLGGEARERRVLADAVHLGLGWLDRGLMEQLLRRWGCEAPEVDLEEGRVGAARWEAAPGLAARVAGADRTLRVTLDLLVDPPLFGFMRDLARRDLRLFSAITGGRENAGIQEGGDPRPGQVALARISLSVAARFTAGFDALSVDPVGLRIGAEAIPLAGAERPEWLPRLWQRIGRRLQRGPAPGRWAEAARSWEAPVQHALGAGLAALRQRPFSLGALRVMPEGLAQLNAQELVPLWQLGDEAELAAGLVAAVSLGGADVLIWEGDLPDRWRPWLARQAEAAGSPLEQVIWFSSRGEVPWREAEGARRPDPAQAANRGALSLVRRARAG